MLSDADFDRIVNHLKEIPPHADPSNRKECWRTADELVSFLPTEHALGSARELDEALCSRFRANEDCPIRFANYPHEYTCKRLWGHITNVGPGPGRNKLLVKLETKPLLLEPDNLVEDLPTIFLSHALEDHHFAGRPFASTLQDMVFALGWRKPTCTRRRIPPTCSKLLRLPSIDAML
jgi:hypothetical protein